MPESHTLLLPKASYYQWVEAVQVYALAFDVPITPNPIKAGSYEHITVIAPPDGYPFEGDIEKWLGEHFPESKVDMIKVNSFDDLKPILQERVDFEMRYGRGMQAARLTLPDDGWIGRKEAVESAESGISAAPLRLEWPTDYGKVTQAFGDNPEIYSQYGLPGHEGVDIRAPMNTNVYACAAGEVYRVEHNPDVHPYGKHIRIRHANGYKTVYGHLASILVSEGNQVDAKQLIGKADSTGNSTGSHLHLTLKKDGATARKETHFKGDVIDPTPFLVYPKSIEGVMREVSRVYPWTKPCLVGLNVRDEGTMLDADFEVVRTARLEAVKVQENTPAAIINQLREESPTMFLMARIAYDMGKEMVRTTEWVSQMGPHMDRLYQLGIRYFEVHQSPNLSSCGWNHSWHSGGGFGRWWMDIVGQLRDRYSGAWFGFPGVSPGGQVEGQRLDARTFLEQADDAIRTADWVGVNCYWANDEEMDDPEMGAFYKLMRERFPEKLLFITEFANVNAMTSMYVKGNDYVEFYRKLRHEPGVGAAFSQVMSSPRGFGTTVWRGEDGALNQIPVRVGKRNF